jgi:hypothetical protein
MKIKSVLTILIMIPNFRILSLRYSLRAHVDMSKHHCRILGSFIRVIRVIKVIRVIY